MAKRVPLRLLKKTRKSQAKQRTDVMEESHDKEVANNEMVKRHFHALLTTPCACCGQPRTLAIAAHQMGLDKSMLWKWANRKGAVAIDHHLQKIEGWVTEMQEKQARASK